MRICFVIGSLACGGAERQLINLAKGLRQRKHDIHIVSLKPLDKENPLACESGLHYHSLSIHGGREMAFGIPSLVSLFYRLRPHIIHSYLPLSNVLMAALKPFIPKHKLVWGIRDSLATWGGYSLKTRTIASLERLLSQVPHRIIVNSHTGQKNLHTRGYRAPQEIIPNGIDTDFFCPGHSQFRQSLGISHENILIGMVTRVQRIKNIERFIAAAAHVSRANSTVRFVLVGSGDKDYKEKLEKMVESQGLSSVFHFYPHITNPVAIYRSLDIHVLTSVAEGFPNTLCEAMACGVPCASAQVGDASAIIGAHGETFNPSTTLSVVNAITLLVKRIQGDKENIRNQCRNHITDNFTCERLVKRTEHVLQQILRS
ncbi:MAG: glycosyltransferase [Alphaproteobacteria bacterium]|nr:MAG: glycosyltransferase [Alphaproteobacteria bacterium]